MGYDKPRKGDMLRVGGRTRKVNLYHGQYDTGATESDIASGKPTSRHLVHTETRDGALVPKSQGLAPGAIIFRWIGGRVVPIRVRG